MRTPRIAAVATLLTLTTFLAACGDDDKDSNSDDDVTETVTASPSETPTTDATETPTAEAPMDPTDGDITLEQVQAALLTPEEVGADFTLGSYDETDDPPPCDPTGTPVDEAVPPSVQSAVQFDHSTGNAAVQEEISIYATEAVAAEAFALGSAGITCSEGTLPDGSAVTITPPSDVTAVVNTSGIGTSTQWGFTGDGYQGTIVATLAGRVIVATTVQATSDFDISTLPNQATVASDAFAKALSN
jgi:hypothetical protein